MTTYTATEVSVATMEAFAQLLAQYKQVSIYGDFARREATKAWKQGLRTEDFWARRCEKLSKSIDHEIEQAKWVEVEGTKVYYMDNSIEVSLRNLVTGEVKERQMLKPPSGDACF